MLFTREYRGFCDRIFGTFIHCYLEYPQPFGHTVDHLKNTTMGNKVVAEPMHDRHASSQERVASLNTDTLLVKMMHQFPTWSLEKHENVMNEYKRYLILILEHGNVAPSSDVDEVWHTHIWTSNKYASDCLTVLRRKFIHHAPETKPGPKSRSAKSFQNTLVKYKAVFGVAAPIEIWGGNRTKKKKRKNKNFTEVKPQTDDGCHYECKFTGLCGTFECLSPNDDIMLGSLTKSKVINLADCTWSCDDVGGDPSCTESCGTLHKQATSTLVDCYEGCTPCFPGKEGNDWNKANDEEGCNHRCAVDCNDVERG